mmetsp:Transcript_51093/g.143610  ORF Transcript_51093/g.143610 Transcript_51093/m.143610 type:complete len:276 (-) Transcript_51093:511-1338(-)
MHQGAGWQVYRCERRLPAVWAEEAAHCTDGRSSGCSHRVLREGDRRVQDARRGAELLRVFLGVAADTSGRGGVGGATLAASSCGLHSQGLEDAGADAGGPDRRPGASVERCAGPRAKHAGHFRRVQGQGQGRHAGLEGGPGGADLRGHLAPGVVQQVGRSLPAVVDDRAPRTAVQQFQGRRRAALRRRFVQPGPRRSGRDLLEAPSSEAAADPATVVNDDHHHGCGAGAPSAAGHGRVSRPECRLLRRRLAGPHGGRHGAPRLRRAEGRRAGRAA